MNVRVLSKQDIQPTKRFIRNTLRLPSGPILISRSRSKDDPRLKAGDAGRPEAGDMTGENDASIFIDGCLGTSLLVSGGGGASSSDVN